EPAHLPVTVLGGGHWNEDATDPTTRGHRDLPLFNLLKPNRWLSCRLSGPCHGRGPLPGAATSPVRPMSARPSAPSRIGPVRSGWKTLCRAGRGFVAALCRGSVRRSRHNVVGPAVGSPVQCRAVGSRE